MHRKNALRYERVEENDQAADNTDKTPMENDENDPIGVHPRSSAAVNYAQDRTLARFLSRTVSTPPAPSSQFLATQSLAISIPRKHG